MAHNKFEYLSGGDFERSFPNPQGGKPVTLHRIRALEEIKNGRGETVAMPEELGGWIEREQNNLAQKGGCWVSGEAQVYGNANVCGNAQVKDTAMIYGGAVISQDAEVSGDAKIFDKTRVSAYAQVVDGGRVSGHAHVFGDQVIDRAINTGSHFGTNIGYDHAKSYHNRHPDEKLHKRRKKPSPTDPDNMPRNTIKPKPAKERDGTREL